MWDLIWLPRPKMNRPFVKVEVIGRASFIGLRANATAMPVPNSRRSVAAAPTQRQERVVGVSAVHTPS